jgi:phage tail-like protein
MHRERMSAGGGRRDPYTGFNFLIEIGGIFVGGFNEASGLSIETEVETRREGGVNNFEYKLPKATKLTDLTLKRGLSDADELWRWYRDVAEGNIVRKEVTIFLRDESGQDVLCWHLFRAFPVRWEGAALNAQSNTVITETLTLAHEGI